MQHAGGGEIIDHIARTARLKEREARKFFRQMVSAIDHCHLSRVVHRDLKLENILLSEDKNILISDFGLGRVYQDDLCNTFCGTPLFASPELVSGIKYPGPPADIWSMGVVLYAMVCGKPPFQAKAIRELYKKIKEVDFVFPDYVSDSFKDLIGKIFVRDVDKRITMSEIREHPWTNKGYEQPPVRVPPKVLTEVQEEQMDQCISIAYDSNVTIYRFNDLPGTIALAEKPSKGLGRAESASNVSMGTMGSSAMLGSPMPTASGSMTAAAAAAASAAAASANGPPLSPMATGTLSSGSTPMSKRFSRSLSIGQSMLRHFLPMVSGNSSSSSSASAPLSPGISGRANGGDVGNTSPTSPTFAVDPLNHDDPQGIHADEHHDQLTPLPSETLPVNIPAASLSPNANGTADDAIATSPTLAGMDLAFNANLSTSPPKSMSLTNTPIRGHSTSDMPPVSPPGSFTSSAEAKRNLLLGSATVGRGGKRSKPRSYSVSPQMAGRPTLQGISSSPAVGSSAFNPDGTPVVGGTPDGKRSRSLFDVGRRRGSSNASSSSVDSSRRPEDEIRSVRIFTLAKTSAKKPPAELLSDVTRILTSLFLPFEKVDSWVLLCTYHSAQNEQVVFEIEICKVWLLSLYGISIKRMSGSLWVYKELYNQISNQLDAR
ncbi:CAMK/CAMKL protein kinase, variant [Capsaspora owczarzaki ATCC 30864]|nr:CAMK/CAMKL protein kinase, variant [Capsaspora owczarzaki ATCC 30864]